MRIAIIGSGIAGMTAAHLLHPQHEVHLFEADGRPGGHANTVRVDLPGGPVAADTGFLVYNERTYPLFTRLLADLGVATHPSDMSFSLTDLRCGLEWRGTSLSTVFAQRRNAARPAFLAMLADVVRFNRLARRLLAEPARGVGLPGGPAGRTAVVGGLPRLVPDPARVGHLVGGPRDLHADPGPDLRRVLQPPRAPRTGRPAGLAHGHRRIDQLRPGDPRAAAQPRPAAPRDGGGQGAASAGRGRAPDRSGPGDLRPRGHGDPQRPGPGPAGRPERRGTPRARRAALPTEPRHAAHRRHAAAGEQTGLGVVELRAPGRPRPGGHADLLPEPAAGLPGRSARSGHAQP